MELNTIVVSDALDLLRGLGDKSVDAVITDMPYGTTACTWDTIIDLVVWWEQVTRVLKPDGAFVTTATQPYASILIASNPNLFKYSWVWLKSRTTDFIRAKLKPMGQHEDVLVFSQASVANGAKLKMRYFPQGIRRVNKTAYNHHSSGGEGLRGGFIGRDASNFGANNKLHQPKYVQEFEGYPSTILRFDSDMDSVHPTQKPVELYEYLIRTYTNEGDIILDPFMGSGTTALAARNTGRQFIGGDSDAGYVAAANLRLINSDPYAHSVLPDGRKQLSLFAGLEGESL